MRKLIHGATVLLAAGIVAGAAQARVPASVSKAVDAWAKVALKAQNRGLVPAASHVDILLQSSEQGCEAAPSEHGPLASVVTTDAGNLQIYVSTTRKGEAKLYGLAPRLGARGATRRKAFLALFNSGRTLISQERTQASAIAATAGLVSAGQCAKAVAAADAAYAALHAERNSLTAVIGQLRTQFG